MGRLTCLLLAGVRWAQWTVADECLQSVLPPASASLASQVPRPARVFLSTGGERPGLDHQLQEGDGFDGLRAGHEQLWRRAEVPRLQLPQQGFIHTKELSSPKLAALTVRSSPLSS